MIIQQDGYAPVECSIPLPCPFCGSEAVMKQLEHTYKLDRKGKPQRICIVASTRTIQANTFWFSCVSCNASTGGHESNAQAAVENWNKRWP